MPTLLKPAEMTVDDVMRRLLLSQRIDALAVRAREQEESVQKIEEIRNHAEAGYKKQVSKLMAAAEADAMRKRKGDELLLYWLMLMDEEGEEQYRKVASGLGVEPTDADVDTFLRSRSELIDEFPVRVRDALRKEAQDARLAGGNNAQVLRKVLEKAKHLEGTEGARLALCEAQAVFGELQIRALREQGYKTKVWVTVGDDRVRPTHHACAGQGSIPLDEAFSNGLMYPGDPNGDMDEIENCRCWLVGGAK